MVVCGMESVGVRWGCVVNGGRWGYRIWGHDDDGFGEMCKERKRGGGCCAVPIKARLPTLEGCTWGKDLLGE